MPFQKQEFARRGITASETVVLIGILFLLLALLMPWVLSLWNGRGRGLGERGHMCGSQMRQIATACCTYETLHKSYPPGLPSCMAQPKPGEIVNNLGVSAGAYCQGPNWLSAVLEQLEEKPSADNLKLCLNHKWNACDECSIAGSEAPDSWTAVGSKVPRALVCPSAPDTFNPLDSKSAGLSNIAKGNYAGCWGMEAYINSDDTADRDPPYFEQKRLTASKKNGMFEHVTLATTTTKMNDPLLKPKGKKLGHDKGTTVNSIKDGVSKTIMISEILGYDSVTDGRGAWTVGAMGCTGFTGKYPPNSTLPDQVPICDPKIKTPEGLICQEKRTTRAFATARSAHKGGVNVSFADYSTHYVSDNIDPIVWQALCTKAGGERVQPPD